MFQKKPEKAKPRMHKQNGIIFA